MEINRWFRDQLLTSADGFIWAVEQVPEARLILQPPHGLGEWTAARHAFHMGFYEQTIALPVMHKWLEQADLPTDVSGEEDDDEDVVWKNEPADAAELLARFKKVRLEQIALIRKFKDTAWNETRDTWWGPVTLRWVVSKTYQHTAEHISDVLRIALFWDAFADHQNSK